jgi:type II secretory pathway pseudopilin PulG
MVELLISMAISTIILMALFSLVGQSTDSYTRTQRAVNTISQARAFIQFFGRELSTRLPGTPMIHEKGSGSGVEASDKIAFVRTLTSDEQSASAPGDLGTSGYFVDYSTDSRSYQLFYRTLDPKFTQLLLESGSNPAFPTAQKQPDGSDKPDEPIIHNILSFQAKPKFRDVLSGVLTDWITTSPQPPSVIELSIRFIDDSTAQRFKTRVEWDRLATSPRENEKQFIRTFTRTIAIAK